MWERELETEQNCNILTPTFMTITVFLSCSPGLLNRGPGGPATLEHVLIPASSFQPQLLNRGSWGPSLLGAGSLYSMLSLTDSNFLWPELYYCFTPTQPFSNTGQLNMQLPLSLEWHVWSSSNGNNCHAVPVHQFVTALWDFNLVPYCQPSSPTQSLPIIG